MTHITKGQVHGYQKRAATFTITVKGPEKSNNWTTAQVHIGDFIEKNVSLDDVIGGIRAHVDLTAAEMDITPAVYPGELIATINGEIHTRAVFTLRVEGEPTPTSPTSP